MAPPRRRAREVLLRRVRAHLFSRNPDDPTEMSVRLGAFDADPGVRPSWRTYVAYAAPWEPIPATGSSASPRNQAAGTSRPGPEPRRPRSGVDQATEADQVCHTLAVLARRSENSWPPRPLEEEVDVVLPREPDAAEGLDRVVGDRVRGVGRARLGHVRGQGQRLRVRVGAPRRVVRQRAGLLDVPEHLGESVRDRLIGADRAPELLALLRVFDRHVERPLGDTDELGRDRDRRASKAGGDVAVQRVATIGADPVIGPRVESISSRRSSSASEPSTILARSRSSSTIRAAPSAAPAIGGSSAVIASAPRCSPEAIPGSQRACWSSLPAAHDHQAGAGVGDQRAGRERVPELLLEDDQLQRAQVPVHRAPRRWRFRANRGRRSRPRSRRRTDRRTPRARGPSPA